MLISTKELRVYLHNLPNKIKATCSDASLEYILNQILLDVSRWELKQMTDLGQPPSGLGVDQEKALVVYCGPKLYEFVEKFSVDSEKDINIVTIGKIYLEVKKALQEGKFKRV